MNRWSPPFTNSYWFKGLCTRLRLRRHVTFVEAEEGFQGTGWFTEDPAEISRKFGGQWRSEDFKAGDILIFGMQSESISLLS